MLTERALKLKNILDSHYPKFKFLVKYLDNENLLKTNLNLQSPDHTISKDVENFEALMIEIKKMMAELETLHLNKKVV